MAAGERFVVLGLAPVRSAWFRDVGRWANEAAIPVEFIRCISAVEATGRLDSGRPFSALLVDASAPGLDRDLIELCASHGCAPVVIDHGLVARDWRALGASAVLPGRFDAQQLTATLEEVAQPIARPGRGAALTSPADPPGEPGDAGRTIAVTGPGGTGASVVAMSVAQGLASYPERRMVLLADMALRSSQALMHDARDMVPGLTELVEAHRMGVPTDSEIAATIFDLPDRGYHLLLGLRHERDWLTISSRSLDAAWRSLVRLYETTVVDITGDFDGSDQTGSDDIEDRNRLARTAVQRADIVVVVGDPTAWGVHRLIRSIVSLSGIGVETARILPCVNRAPRHPRARAEVSTAVADLLATRVAEARTMPNPVFVPHRKQLEASLRDGTPLSSQLVDPVTVAVRSLLRSNDSTATPAPAEPGGQEPIPVAPGSLGSWSTDDE